MSARDRQHRDPALIGDLLMPWERDEMAGEPQGWPTFHSVDPVTRVLLLDRQGSPLLVEEPPTLGFDPSRIKR